MKTAAIRVLAYPTILGGAVAALIGLTTMGVAYWQRRSLHSHVRYADTPRWHPH